MKLSLLTLAFALLAFIPQSYAMKDKMAGMAHEKANIKAVMFFSENCGSCKILDPRLKEAMNAINQNKVDVVKFDFTNEATKMETQKLADKKGLGKILSEYGPKTGFVALIDKNGNVIDKLKVDHDTAEIAAKLAKAIASTS